MDGLQTITTNKNTSVTDIRTQKASNIIIKVSSFVLGKEKATGYLI